MSGPETIEEELAIIAEALEAGIDPFLPKKEPKPEPHVKRKKSKRFTKRKRKSFGR